MTYGPKSTITQLSEHPKPMLWNLWNAQFPEAELCSSGSSHGW
jgi:hypothetical protein